MCSDNIKPVLNNVKFFVEKKTVLKYTDNGIVDIIFGGSGVTIDVIWSLTTSSDSCPKLTAKSVKCSLDKLKIHVNQSKHKLDIIFLLFNSSVQRT